MHFEWYHIPLVAGILFLVYGLYRLKRYTSMCSKCLRADGSVYDIITKKDEKGADDYYMVIGFITQKQALIIEEINVSFNPYEYQKGDTVGVLYNTQNPEKFILDENKVSTYTYIFCLAPGIVFILVGMWMICMKDVNAYG